MKTVRLAGLGVSVLTVALLAAPTSTASARPHPGQGPRQLQVDSLDNPLGVDDATPTLSWESAASGAAADQRAYQVRAATGRGHLDHPDMPGNSMADAEQWAAGMAMPAYAIDDETAIKVADGKVEVVSEGHWKLFTP